MKLTLKRSRRYLKRAKKLSNDKEVLYIKKNKVYYKEDVFKKSALKRLYRIKNEAPKLTYLEEIGNSVTHGVGAILALVGMVLLILRSKNTTMVVAGVIYTLSLFIMMLMSCLYHAFRWGKKVKRIWRRFDYTSIYLLIGGTFTPLQLVDLGGTLGLIWFIIMWVLIIFGITMVCIFGPGRLHFLHYPLYFIIGWSGLLFLPGWIKNNMNLLIWILSGGVVYTLGMIPFVKRGVKNAHFIWHFFVLGGAIVHFLGIMLCVY